jgi:pantoate--beta-alanine ligase
MRLARSLDDLRAGCAALRALHGRLALVPTMGALHEGHCALLHAARADAGVVASIFVNPLQFAPSEDFARYPRDEAGDLATLEAAGCDLVWLPDVAVMYPPGDSTTIVPAGPAERWEGAARPSHFRGVATVVAKLFGQVRPDDAYFGEKDWQQVQVIRRMVTDLLLPVSVVAVATVRESDGLALSSRNRYLAPAERAKAGRLYAVLSQTARVLAAGGPAEAPLRQARAALEAAGFALDYLELVDGATLEPLAAASSQGRLLVAARLGGVRLIDNVAVK